MKSALVDGFLLARHPREGLKSVYGVSLYRNAGYLMAKHGLTAILGFFFWMIVARLYPAEDVGLASALISAAMLVSFMGTLGLGYGIIRFVSSSANRAALLNSSYTIVVLASAVLAVGFLVGIPVWSPDLTFVRESAVFVAAFVVFVVAGSMNEILHQTFVGLRRGDSALARGIIAGVGRLPLVVALAAFFRVFGIFASWGLAMIISAAISLLVLVPRTVSSYKPGPSLRREATKDMVRFSFANYSGRLLQSAPAWILPLMVLNVVGAEANAHFYVTWRMADILLAISMMTSASLFAEGSNLEEGTGVDLRRSIKLVALLLVPAVLIILLLGGELLRLFGVQYAEEGTPLLRLLAVSAVPASINYLYLGIARVEKKLKSIILVTGVIAVATLVVSHLLLPILGVLGAGVGWLSSQTVLAAVLVPRLAKVSNRRGVAHRDD